MMALVDIRRQLDGRVESRTRAHTCMKAATHLCRLVAIRENHASLPGTLVSGCCKSGLSASEDTDHISEKRRIGAYRLREGDGQGEKEAGKQSVRIGGHV